MIAPVVSGVVVLVFIVAMGLIVGYSWREKLMLMVMLFTVVLVTLGLATVLWLTFGRVS